MSPNEEEIIKDLKADWEVQSITSHVKGYWNFEDTSFDLRDLKEIKDLKGKDTGRMYLRMKDGQVFLCRARDESYYQVERINRTELKLSCYFKNQIMDEHIKLATFELRRK
jgi:hypothetical protein